MKIGAFARRYDLKPSAVRYYVDKALLTPKRENGQYIFDKTCMEQMDNIIKYKKFRFSLEEIEVLSYYERASNLRDKDVVRLIISNLKDKISQLDSEIAELTDIRQQLFTEIDEYRAKYNSREITEDFSVPLEVLEILRCPVCQSKLPLIDAVIDDGGIKEGALHCACGYEASISKGVLLCEGFQQDTPFKAFENINSVLALTDDFSPSYRNLMEKAHLWMYQQIGLCKKDFKYIMAGPFAYNFLLKHLKDLPENSLYIISDISVEKIRKLKEYFAGIDKKILFIAGDINNIPIKQASLDLYIDDFSNSNYIFTYNTGIFETVSRFMKRKSNITGVFIDYTTAPNSLENFKKDHENFDPKEMSLKKIYSGFTSAGIKILEKNNLGSPHGHKKDFTRQSGEEKIQVVSYFAEKTE